MFIRCLSWIFLCLGISGCGDKPAHERLANYVNDPDNKIIQSTTSGGVKVSSKFIPDNLLDLAEKRDDRNYLYFDFRIEPMQKISQPDEKTLYLNFDMQHDFTLVSDGVDIAPAICQKIENGRPECYQYMLAFELQDKKSKNKGFTLRYNDRIFGAGTVGFIYTKKDIQRIPGI